MPDQDTPSEPPSKPTQPRKPKPKSSRSVEARPSWIPRPMHAAVCFVLILTVGWTGYQVIHRQSQVDENAELADLDGFESPSASLEESDPAEADPSEVAPPPTIAPFTQRRAQSVAAWSSAASPSDAALTPPPPLPGVQSAIFEQNPIANSFPDPSSGAWLLGTIEADEAAADSLPLPPLAREPSSGPVLR